MGGRMRVMHEDLLGPEAIADPYTYYGRLREEDPIHWNPLYETWVLTRKAASSPCLRPGSTLALRGRGFHPALDQGDAHAPLEPQHKVPRPNGRGLNGFEAATKPKPTVRAKQ